MPILFNTDSYKYSHFLGYPKGTEEIYSYMESRGGQYERIPIVGIRAIIDTIGTFSMADILEAEDFASMHGIPFNKDWYTIFKDYGGHLPIVIEGVREGTIVKPGEPILAVYNTDWRFPWITSYVETMLLRLWYPTTVAARVLKMKEKISHIFQSTTDTGNMDFAILDFGSRGATSEESSALGGLGHLAHFVGSDNIPAVRLANRVYNIPMSGYSVSATEHSVMTAWTKEHELESFEYLIENMAPRNGILSVVADSWNVYTAADKFVSLREKIRNKNVTLVFRPDSGSMTEVLPTVLEKLYCGFGGVENSKGYYVLDNVKVLWGDGINETTVNDPFDIAAWTGISADSIMTGSGGGLLQANLDRDTCRFAFKASNAVVDGKSFGINKEPITSKSKVSKKGKFVFPELYYSNGVINTNETFDDIRNRIKNFA